MNLGDINDFMPSVLNPRAIKRHSGLSQTQISSKSRSSLSLKKCKLEIKQTFDEIAKDKENSVYSYKQTSLPLSNEINVACERSENDNSFGFSVVRELNCNDESSILSFSGLDLEVPKDDNDDKNNNSLISISSKGTSVCSDTTVIYEKPMISLSFSVNNCNNLNISSKYSNIKNVAVDCSKSGANVDCVIEESSLISEDKAVSNINNLSPSLSSKNKKSVSVNLEIKKQKLTLTGDEEEKPKVLILNTNAIEKLSHVIVQPPNYKLVKRKIRDKRKLKSKRGNSYNGKSVSDGLNQIPIDAYFKSANGLRSIDKSVRDNVSINVSHALTGVRDDARDMSKNLGIAVLKCDIGRTLKERRNDKSPKVASHPASPKREIKASISEAKSGASPRTRKDSISSHSPIKNGDPIQFSLPLKLKSHKTSVVNRNIPHYKIVAGTHFAVDAFSYGDIPYVKHYFLTHFHSDHYSGLKKNFNKMIFCSQITADLCMSRLGVSSKCIHVMNADQSITVEDVEITAVDANHCPGALMLVFTLPNGKTLLHTGDFRGCPAMESYPVFWNKDVHTIYLDTTYCNPRYDFPTQDQSLEMALYILRQKKVSLEKAGKQFSSVLIVCGTYTIGKEKFFLGLARRVGCSVWACPEKDRVLQAVEGRSFSHAPPASCQLHVVPMRDLVHEKLHTYLESLKGSFSEVVAFKPSGWEIGRNSSVQKDFVTIHGIPYSEHSSFSELIRFVKFLKPKQVVPTVDISGGIKAVQKYFPCPLVNKEEGQCQSRVTDFFTQGRQQLSVT